jgi:hypothetical protein
MTACRSAIDRRDGDLGRRLLLQLIERRSISASVAGSITLAKSLTRPTQGKLRGRGMRQEEEAKRV